MQTNRKRTQRPRIVAVDRDAATRALLADELDGRYGRHYDIVVIAASSDEARDVPSRRRACRRRARPRRSCR